MYPLLVYFIAIALGTMYEFLFIVGFALFGVSALLTLAYVRDHRVLKIVGKAANVGLTIIGFINIFSSDMYFNDFLEISN